jgi:hypothetical protein
MSPSNPETRRLQHLQKHAFEYFLHEANPENGLIRDKNAAGWPASIAATGLALATYPVAVERGLMSAQAALERTLTTLRFLRASPQGNEVDASGYRGFYYHFLDMHSGRRAWDCELSSVDSAFLLAGVLTAAEYFANDSAPQREVREHAQFLYERVDWSWMQDGLETLGHGWKPESGFMKYRWEGYDEALLLYVLALGSPTHPASTQSFAAWASTYEWLHCYDIDYLYAGPLFTHQLSHCWIDFRGVQDAFMREKGIDYFENSRRACQIQQRYAIDNPLHWRGYGADVWGITASDGPGPTTRSIDGVERFFYDYEGRGAPYGLDDGTVSPWAVVAGLPFAPDLVLPTIDHYMRGLDLHDRNRYGFAASFNPSFGGETGRSCGWVSPYHFGINLAPIVLMIENHRSGLLWQLMRGCAPILQGMRRAGFTGAWLQSARDATT